MERGVSPPPATTRPPEVVRRDVAPMGIGSNSSNSSRSKSNNNRTNSSARSPTNSSLRDSTSSNTSMVEAGQARTGEVVVSGNKSEKVKQTRQQQDPHARGGGYHSWPHISWPPYADGGGGNQPWPLYGDGGGGNESWPRVRDARFNCRVPTAPMMQPYIPLTYVDLKALKQESTPLTPGHGVACAA